jgi:hydroxyacylglutathione hydrolase/adenylyltransferase/sulfurtransferase
VKPAGALDRRAARYARGMPSIFDSASSVVTPEQTQSALADDSAQVIDVREGYEWEAGRIEGTLHIEIERLASSTDSVDKDRPVIFHCRLGARSAMAAQAFRGIGVDAYSMAGGIQRWSDEGRPMIPDGAVVADH